MEVEEVGVAVEPCTYLPQTLTLCNSRSVEVTSYPTCIYHAYLCMYIHTYTYVYQPECGSLNWALPWAYARRGTLDIGWGCSLPASFWLTQP